MARGPDGLRAQSHATGRPTTVLFLIVGLFAVLLVAASTRGMFWSGVLLACGSMYVAVSWAYPVFGHRTAILALAVLSSVLVIPVLRPVEVNYAVYVSVLLLTVGLLSLLRRRQAPPVPFMLFLIWVAFTGVFTVLRTGLQPSYLPFVVPALMLGAYLVVACSDDVVREYFLKVLLALALLQALLGISQALIDWPVFTQAGAVIRFEEPRNYFSYILPWVSPSVRMATGTYEHFNGLGALMAMGVPVTFAYWRQFRGGWRLLVLCIITLGLIFTFSRGALIGVLVALSVMYLSDTRDRESGLRKGVMAAVVLMFFAGIWNTAAEYGATTGNVSGRVLTWSTAWQYARQDPLSLALGYGHSFFAYYLVVLRGIPDRLHSAPVQVALETGITGIALLASSTAIAIRRGLGDRDWVFIGSAGAVVAFLVHQSVDNSLLAYNGAWFSGLIALASLSPSAQSPSGVEPK